jgi:hypothetical protein
VLGSSRAAVIGEIVAKVGTDRARFGMLAIIVQMLFSLALVAAPACAFAEGFSRVSLPIPVEIDGRSVHCPLYFKLDVKYDNVPFDRFLAGQMNSAQTMFVTGVQALRKGHVAKFASVWTAPNQMKTSGRVSIALADNSPRGWMNVARSSFDFDKITVVAESQAGSDTMFVVDLPTKSGPTARTAFYVGPDKNNQTRLSVVGSGTPVLALRAGCVQGCANGSGGPQAIAKCQPTLSVSDSARRRRQSRRASCLL